MKHLTRRRAGIAALLLLLAASTAFNILYFHRAQSMYEEVQRVRLDPLGTDVYGAERTRPRAAASNVRVVLYGDSRVQQWGEPQLAGATVLNRGVGAQTSAQALGRLPYDVLPLKPDVVVIQVGINDLKTVPLFPERAHEIITRCQLRIRKMAQLAARSGARVILTTVLPLAKPDLGKDRTDNEQIQAAVEHVNRFILSLRRDGFKVLDVASVVADGEGNVAPHFRKDEFHISSAGYAALNSALASALPAFIEASPSASASRAVSASSAEGSHPLRR